MDKAANVKVKGDPVWYGPGESRQPALAYGSATKASAIVRRVLHDRFGIDLAATDPTATRYVVGSLDNGLSYLVRVIDNGEPGRDDSFSIVLLSKDSTTGALTSTPSRYAATSEPNGLGGGNIQLHKPNC